MSSDSTPTEQTAVQTPNAPPPGEGGKQKRPVAVDVLAGVAIAAAIGLGVWAIVLNDDLNETEAQLRPRPPRPSRPRPRPRVVSRMLVRASRPRSPASRASVVSDEDVAEAEQADAEAEQSVAEAQAAVDQAQSEVEQARQNAVRPEPRRNKLELKGLKPNCARTPRSQPRRRCPRTTTRRRHTRRLRLAQRPPRVRAREVLNGQPTPFPSRGLGW